MGQPLTKEQCLFLQQQRELGVLCDTAPEKLNRASPNGVIVCCCADGFQLPDFFGHLQNMILGNDGDRLIHVLTDHGGALWLDPQSPIQKYMPENMGLYLKKILDATLLKKIFTIVLSVHAPCGMANKFDISLQQLIHSLVQGKIAVKEFLLQNEVDPNLLNVACFFHVHYPDVCLNTGERKRRTYFVDAQKFAKVNGLN